MPSKPSKPGPRDPGLGLELSALLEPHLDALGEAARTREQAARDARAQAAAHAQIVRLSEAELMDLVFASLDYDNPRVCEGIDFDRLVILTRSEPPAAELELESEQACEPEFGLETSPVDASAWVGRSWAGDVLPTPASVLERPELLADQRALLTRASRRKLAMLNLRHLYRADALHHLELFIGVCRTRRLRFCRVIPGKGVHSKAEPVIKRAVIEWCREHERDAVIGWAPEIDQHGEWGAMILELRTFKARAQS